ncbi:hypothetical protein ACFQHO_03045 [Actinomadura yumaensis]|uniref:hypothetical protein n=1 Tax=Actinomadura yumaensis TaxID=111807 RepID=UPI00360CF46B
MSVMTHRRGARRLALAAAGTTGLLLAVPAAATANVRAPGAGPAAAPAVTSARAVQAGGWRQVAPERREGRVRLALPEPTGPRRVGTTSLHLIDRSRRDPWTSPAPRELMVSLWYPARGAAGHPRAPWFPPAASELYEQQTSQGLRTPLDGVDFPVTHGHEGAPVAVRPGGHPVVLYSPATARSAS